MAKDNHDKNAQPDDPQKCFCYFNKAGQIVLTVLSLGSKYYCVLRSSQSLKLNNSYMQLKAGFILTIQIARGREAKQQLPWYQKEKLLQREMNRNGLLYGVDH